MAVENPSSSAGVPTFTLLSATGTLKIPLSTTRAAQVPPQLPIIHLNRGQPLDSSQDSVRHRAIAPVAGTTGRMCEVSLFSGQGVPAVEFICSAEAIAEQPAISVEASATSSPSATSSSPLESASRKDLETWIARFREAGIYATRHASPDLLSQLIEAADTPVVAVLCNLLDSDPSVPQNAALGRQFSQEIVAGTVLLSRIVGASQTAMCVDQRLPASWSAGLRKLTRKTPTRVVSMVNDYPQADPTLLLYTLLNRRLRPGRLPVEQGVLVIDAAAAYAIGSFALADEPMTHVPLAVRDHVKQLSHFVLAPVGMQLLDLLSTLGGLSDDTFIRGGDLLRDLPLPRESVVSGSELLIHLSDPEPNINPDTCIRCGWCIEACPTRVQPAVVLEAAQRDDPELADRAGIEACIDCGICSYVCPSKLPLLDEIRVMKKRHGV